MFAEGYFNFSYIHLSQYLTSKVLQHWMGFVGQILPTLWIMGWFWPEREASVTNLLPAKWGPLGFELFPFISTTTLEHEKKHYHDWPQVRTNLLIKRYRLPVRTASEFGRQLVRTNFFQYQRLPFVHPGTVHLKLFHVVVQERSCRIDEHLRTKINCERNESKCHGINCPSFFSIICAIPPISSHRS